MAKPDASFEHHTNRNTLYLFIWTIAWTATLALATMGPKLLWDSNATVTWIAIGANIAAGIGMMVAWARYLRGLDELQRKIQMDAMAVTLGVGFVGGFAYVAMDLNSLIELEASVSVYSMALAVVYVAAIVAGTVRYR